MTSSSCILILSDLKFLVRFLQIRYYHRLRRRQLYHHCLPLRCCRLQLEKKTLTSLPPITILRSTISSERSMISSDRSIISSSRSTVYAYKFMSFSFRSIIYSSRSIIYTSRSMRFDKIDGPQLRSLPTTTTASASLFR